MYMRELWGSKLGLAIAALVALVAAAQVLYAVRIFPPGLEGRSLDVATASTHVLVDTPHSTITDLRQNVYEIQPLSTRAVILGNVMASPQVRERIGRHLGVPARSIQATGPLTPEQPRPVAGSDSAPHVSDILQRPDQFRLSVKVNPAVPVLDVYTEAPTPDEATALADAAVAGLRDYVRAVAAERGTAPPDRVRLDQLGRAEGGVINDGVGTTFAVVVFVLVFILCAAAVLFIRRIRQGWVAAPAPGPRARGLA